MPRAGWDGDSFGIAHHSLLDYDEENRCCGLGEFKINPDSFTELVSTLHANRDLQGSVVVSTERFASLCWQHIDQLHKLLSSFECCFVFGERSLADLHISIWRKRIELGWRIPLDQSVKTIFPELMYMLTFLPKLIARKFGQRAIRMVAYTSNHQENLVRLAAACGMDSLITDSVFMSLLSEQPVLSESLSYQEVERLRMANESICMSQGFDEWVPNSSIAHRDEMAKSLPDVLLDAVSTSRGVQINLLQGLYQACKSPYFPGGLES